MSTRTPNTKTQEHAQRAKELAAEFLAKLENEGYEGYAIVGVPNPLIESQLEKHMETCEHCRTNYEVGGELCDDGFDAMFEDDRFNVFAYSTRDVGEFDYGLLGDLHSGNFNDVACAEPYRPETNHPQVPVRLYDGKEVQCDSGVTDLILAMNFPGIATHHSCQGTHQDKDNCEHGYVTFAGPLAKPFAQSVLEEMFSDDEMLGITFENSDCCCSGPGSLLMRWCPSHYTRMLQYTKTAANKLRGEAEKSKGEAA